VTFEPRYLALLDLISARQPIEQTIGHLRTFPWDSDRVLAVLYRADASRVLHQYLRGEMSAEQCVAWADAIEARDDIAFELDRVELLKRLIFEVANPELEGPLSLEAASAWLRMLEDPGPANANSECVTDEPDLFGGEAQR